MLQFVRQLFSRSKPETDWSFGLIKELNIEALLAKNQWTAFEEAATHLSADDLTRLLDGLCLTKRYILQLKQYWAAGESELRTLSTGAHTLFLAWEARGSLVASATNEQQADGFIHYLNRAYDLLNQQFDRPAWQAEAAARLVRVGMGMSEIELAQGAFDLCTELAPTHLMGHFNYTRAVSPWWHEGTADLTAFVDSITEPTLHHLFQIIYLNEIHSFLSYEKNSDAATKILRQEYGPRLDAVLAGPQQATGSSLAAVYFNNCLASLHHILGNKAARNQLITTLGANITVYPWSYFGLTTADAVQRLA
jgi:hypothetical protein